MARIRTIKPEFFTSEQIVECSPSARLLFVGLWCFSDDGGVHPASHKRLKMEVFPGDTITDGEIEGLVDELIIQRLIVEFESQGQRYWHVTGWARHQKIDRPTIKYPRALDDGSTIIRRVLVEQSPMARDGMEGNGMETNGYGEDSSSASAEEANQFLQPPPTSNIAEAVDSAEACASPAAGCASPVPVSSESRTDLSAARDTTKEKSKAVHERLRQLELDFGSLLDVMPVADVKSLVLHDRELMMQIERGYSRGRPIRQLLLERLASRGAA